MAEFIIPCDVIARLSNVLRVPNDIMTDWFKAIRVDNGVAVVTNRRFMAVEKLPDANNGVVHIPLIPKLIAQCKIEGPLKSNLYVQVLDGMGIASARTTLGWQYPGNACVVSSEINEFDRWRDVVQDARDVSHKPAGGMYWDAEGVAALAASAPSGCLVFAENIDTMRPTIIRDTRDYNWFGVFRPREPGQAFPPAVVPTWMA